MIETVTHAKLRASQGDLAGARSILLAILRRTPDHTEAQELLLRYSGQADAPRKAELVESLSRPEPATAESLGESFRRALGGSGSATGGRADRLRTWLARIRRSSP